MTIETTVRFSHRAGKHVNRLVVHRSSGLVTVAVSTIVDDAEYTFQVPTWEVVPEGTRGYEGLQFSDQPLWLECCQNFLGESWTVRVQQEIDTKVHKVICSL